MQVLFEKQLVSIKNESNPNSNDNTDNTKNIENSKNEEEHFSGHFLDYQIEIEREKDNGLTYLTIYDRYNEEKYVDSYYSFDLTNALQFGLNLIENDMKDRLDTFNDEKEILKEYAEKYLNQELEL